jgi:hypothetical protein
MALSEGTKSAIIWVFNAIVWLVLCIAPITGYPLQALKFRRDQSSSSFSSFVSFVLLISNTIRIAYWITYPFDENLLDQAIIMSIAQLSMVYACAVFQRQDSEHFRYAKNRGFVEEVSVTSMITRRYFTRKARTIAANEDDALIGGEDAVLDAPRECHFKLLQLSRLQHRIIWAKAANPINWSVEDLRHFAGYLLSDFWNWAFPFHYYFSYTLFCAVLALVTWVFFASATFSEYIGLLATLSEATLAMPQVWKNFRRKSTAGLSLWLLFTWVAGDVTKVCPPICSSRPAFPAHFFIVLLLPTHSRTVGLLSRGVDPDLRRLCPRLAAHIPRVLQGRRPRQPPRSRSREDPR